MLMSRILASQTVILPVLVFVALSQPPSPAAVKAADSPLAKELAEVDKLAESHSFYKARKILEPLLIKHEEDARVHLSAARLFIRMGQPSRAIDEFRRVRQLSPSDLETLVTLSRLYLDNNDTSSALTVAKEALKIAPQSKDARMLLVQTLMTKGLLLEAEQELKKLLKGDMKDARLHFTAAQLYRDRGQPGPALSHIERAIEIEPSHYHWLIVKSDICVSLAKYKEARKAIEHVVECDPQSVESLNKLATIKENYFRDYDGAIECYQRILEIDPDSVTALAGLDRLRAKKNDLAGQWKHQLKSTFSRLQEAFRHGTER